MTNTRDKTNILFESTTKRSRLMDRLLTLVQRDGDAQTHKALLSFNSFDDYKTVGKYLLAKVITTLDTVAKDQVKIAENQITLFNEFSSRANVTVFSLPCETDADTALSQLAGACDGYALCLISRDTYMLVRDKLCTTIAPKHRSCGIYVGMCKDTEIHLTGVDKIPAR